MSASDVSTSFRQALDSWNGKFGESCSFEVLAVCETDAIGEFPPSGEKTIQLVAKVNTRLARESVAITLRLGNDAKFDTVTELAGRLKKDRQFSLLLEYQNDPKHDRKGWFFNHALVDNIKLKIEKMISV